MLSSRNVFPVYGSKLLFELIDRIYIFISSLSCHFHLSGHTFLLGQSAESRLIGHAGDHSSFVARLNPCGDVLIEHGVVLKQSLIMPI